MMKFSDEYFHISLLGARTCLPERVQWLESTAGWTSLAVWDFSLGSVPLLVAGRPLLGASEGTIGWPSSPWAGLSRSTVTRSGRPPMLTRKVLTPASRTQNGPSYGGHKECRWASWRMKTNSATERSFGHPSYRQSMLRGRNGFESIDSVQEGRAFRR